MADFGQRKEKDEAAFARRREEDRSPKHLAEYRKQACWEDRYMADQTTDATYES